MTSLEDFARALRNRVASYVLSVNQPRRTPLETIAWLQLATAAGLLVYWPLFFTGGLAPADPPFGYFAFHHPFTIPDIILASTFIRAATWLLSADPTRQGRGRALSLFCSGALVFLGLLDISFNLLNSAYTLQRLNAAIEMAVIAWCIGFGAVCALRVSSAYEQGQTHRLPPG
jgi:hypothetical protein